MEVPWERGESSIGEILDSLPAEGRPAYNTIQTMVYRMEPKGVVRRIKKVGNFHIFAASISRDAAQRRLIEELLALFGVRSQPVMAHLVDAGKVSLEDVKEAERALRKLSGKEKQS
jgi:BlaI family penicillinase repressor